MKKTKKEHYKKEMKIFKFHHLLNQEKKLVLPFMESSFFKNQRKIKIIQGMIFNC